MPGILREYPSFFDFLLRITDPAIVIAVSLILQHFAPQICSHDLLKVLTIYSTGLVVLIFPFFNLYRSWRGIAISTEIFTLSRAWIAILILFNLIIMLLANDAQREVLWPYGLLKVESFWIWAGITWAGLAGSRIVIRYCLRFLRYWDVI